MRYPYRSTIALLAITLQMLLIKPSTPAQAVAFPDREASASEASATVPILSREGGTLQPLCTGALISSTQVVTAAHCLYGKTSSELVVGKPGAKIEDLRSGKSELREIVMYGIHTNYLHRENTRFGTNDIAKLIITHAFSTYSTLAVPTPAAATESLRGELQIIGYGADQNSQVRGTPMLGKVVDMSSSGAKYYSDFNPVTQISAGFYREDQRVFVRTCKGDSGGPLIGLVDGVKTLIGVTSFGAVDCSSNTPSFFMRASYYSKFLIETDWYRERIAEDKLRVRTLTDNLCDAVVYGTRMFVCRDADIISATITSTSQRVSISYIATPLNGKRIAFVELDENGDDKPEWLFSNKGLFAIDRIAEGQQVCATENGLNFIAGCLTGKSFNATLVIEDDREDIPYGCGTALNGVPCRIEKSSAIDRVALGTITSPALAKVDEATVVNHTKPTPTPRPTITPTPTTIETNPSTGGSKVVCASWKGDSVYVECTKGGVLTFKFCNNYAKVIAVERAGGSRWVRAGTAKTTKNSTFCEKRNPHLHDIKINAPVAGQSYRVRLSSPGSKKISTLGIEIYERD